MTKDNVEFFSDIIKLDLLSKQDIEHYLNLYRNGDENARGVLINRNLKLILAVIYSKGYNLSKIDIEDLFQEGVVALIKSIELCKKNSDLNFYDYTKNEISSKLFQYILSKGKLLGLPQDYAKKVYGLIRKQYKIYDFEFDYDQIKKSSNLNIDNSELSKINLLLSPIENYNDEFIGYNDVDIMSDNCFPIDFDFEISDVSIWKKVEKLLTKKQYQVLLLRLGKDASTLKNIGSKKLEECAKILNITPQAVNNLELSAYKRLKMYLGNNEEYKKMLYK